jgi:hypothetical protein
MTGNINKNINNSILKIIVFFFFIVLLQSFEIIPTKTETVLEFVNKEDTLQIIKTKQFEGEEDCRWL